MIRRIPHAIVAVALFGLFFLWGTRGKPWLFFTAFWPTIHLLYGVVAAAIALCLTLRPDLVRLLRDLLVRRRYFIFPPITALATALISWLVFDNIPHVIDAAHFLWSARLMLDGSLSLPAGDLYEFSDVTFMVRDGGRHYSLFLPGFSLALAPFAALGIPWLLVPLASGLSVWLTGRIADRFFNGRVSCLAMALCTFSSFYLFMGASFMTHNFNLLLLLTAVWLVTRDHQDGRALFAASAAIALSLFMRPQNALFTYLPLGIYLLLKRATVFRLTLFAIPALLGGAALLGYNHLMTGHLLTFPQDLYFSVIEPIPFCHRIGLGTGCPNTEGEFLPAGGLTLDYAYWVAYTRLTLMLFNVAGHPYPFLFLIVAFFFGLRRNLFLSSFFLTFFIGYFFFYLSGNLFGPRYFTEVTTLLLIPAAAGVVYAARFSPRPLRPFIAAFPLAGILFVSAVIMPELLSRYSDRFWVTDRSFEKAIEERDIRDSVVFVPAPYHSMFLTLQERPPFDRRGNLILKDLGRENLYGAAYYMETLGLKNAWAIDYYPKLRNLAIVEELPDFRVNDIWIEFEHKGRPATGRPAYATPVAAGVKLTYLPFTTLDEDLNFSKDQGYAVLFGAPAPDSYYDITHPILDPGDYELTIEMLAAPCGGECSFTVNDAPVATFSAYDDGYRFKTLRLSAPLRAGTNRFAFIPQAGQSCLILDYIRLKKKDAAPAPEQYPDYTPPEWKELNK